jgi:hypothetical protein
MKKIILNITAIAALGSLLPGCKKFLDVNDNPNSPTSTKAALIFPGALNRSAGNSIGIDQLGAYFGGHYSNSNSFIGGAAHQTYNITDATYGHWQNQFDVLYDYQFVVDKADAEGVSYLKHMSNIMKAMHFQNLVDLYGNIPYSQALKGADLLLPKFDDAKTVYEGLVTLIDQSIAGLKAATVPNGSGIDIMFGGDKTKWIKFANSLKLRILMRQSYMPGRDTYLVPKINEVAADGIMDGFDATSNPSYQSGTAGKLNQYYATYGYDQNNVVTNTNRYVRPSAQMVTFLKSKNDTFRMKQVMWPRGNAIGVTGPSANYVGVPFGFLGNLTTEVTSAVGGPSLTPQYSSGLNFVQMVAAEAWFCLAEAKVRWAAVNYNGQTAQQLYEKGVRESFRTTGTASAAATTLLTSGLADADFAAAGANTANQIRTIMMQKWVALFNYSGLSAWSEARKSEIPVPAISVQAITPTAPVRLDYPRDEKSTNGSNVQAQGTVNIFTTKIFWDVN